MTGWAWAQTAREGNAALPEVLVRAQVKGQALDEAQRSFSVTEFGSDDIREQPRQEVEALWNKVPGMYVNHYQLSGVANGLVLRGFGGGGHGGDVAATLDGISLNEAMSHADGYFDLNVVVPLELDKVNVHRGPVSVLQGNYNRAGLVELRTRRSGSYTDVDVSAGSQGMLDAQAALGRELEGGDQLNLAAQHSHGDGARPSSGHGRSTISGTWKHHVHEKLDISLSGRWHEARGDSPGYLTEAQWRQDPQGKDGHVVGDGANKHFGTLRLDAQYALDADTRLLGFVYGTQQDFVRWFTRPRSGTWMQREERYDRSVLGAGLNLSGKSRLAARELNWMLGLEQVRESTDYGYWDGLVNRRRTAAALDDRNTRLNNMALYGQGSWQATGWLQTTAALRWDHFDGRCRLLGAETGGDECNRMQGRSHASPKLGAMAQLNPQTAVRASWSQGFALPSDFAKYALRNSELGANIFRQTELGLQWKPSSQWLIDAAVYRVTSSNEIRNTAPGEYENLGATLRKGAELQLHWLPGRSWHLEWAYGRNRSEITQNANAALQGQRVVAVPEYTSTLHARWMPRGDVTVHGVLRHVGRAPINAGNTEWAGSYHWLDLGLQYRLPASVARHASLSLWLRNAANARYASITTMIGGQRLVAPGAPRSVQLGLQFSL
ncbi:TonB-dependent receptor [Comamonas resistens]|uniref:TonB-dependent receptor n=1 Tax=Comamonas resistens TaxID=3046670 RepID=A0ABY8SZ86_9BURK|nr:TonB-dependent receptor [Comamonas resistens]MDL5036894.1 TonB-dependent receptor [Comamonas resistens]WHS67204.1 TonB-dependent receptor [Comamonas resistens]